MRGSSEVLQTPDSRGVHILRIVASSRVAPAAPAGPSRRTQTAGRAWRLSAARWRPLASARGRILGWSVLLLAAGIATSTIATRVLLVQGMNAQVRSELAHEIGEFRALAARRTSTTGPGRPGEVVALLRARTRQAVLERDTVLIGMSGT